MNFSTEKKLVLPRHLKTGDTIGVIAISSPCEEQRFLSGVRYLESFGFRVKVALDPCRAYGKNLHLFSSDSALERAQALHALFSDQEVAAVLVARGAYGSMEVLPHIDFDLLRGNSKPICGFSDATAVLVAVYQKAGIVTVHAPSLESAFSKAAQGEDAGLKSSRTLVDFLLCGRTGAFSGEKLVRVSGKGAAEGPLNGGNLTMLSHLMGTAWEPDFDGHVVFLEESGERPYNVHRMLLQMKLAGKFAGVKGVLLGRFSECVHPRGLGPGLRDVFKDIFKDYDLPVLGFASFGHAGVNYPLPYGVCVSVSETGMEMVEGAFK